MNWDQQPEQESLEVIHAYIRVALLGIVFIVGGLIILAIANGQPWGYIIFGAALLIYFALIINISREREHVNYRHDQREERRTLYAQAEAARIKAEALRLRALSGAPTGTQRQALPEPAEEPKREELPAMMDLQKPRWATIENGTPAGVMVPYNRDELERIAIRACRILPPAGLAPSQGNIEKHAGASGGGQSSAVQMVMKEWGWIEQPREGTPYTWAPHVTHAIPRPAPSGE